MSGAFAVNQRLTKHAICTKRGVVSAQNHKAATIGADVLADGGNAVDAAIATSLALGVCEPWMSGLGGGGVMLHLDNESGRASAFDFGMVAARGLDPAAYPVVGGRANDLFPWAAVKDDRNIVGPLSMAVPGYLDGLALASDRLGSMPFASLVRPAIALAVQGLEIDWFSSLLTTSAARDLRRFPSSAARFLPDGLPPVPAPSGETAFIGLDRLPDTLQVIAAEGPRSLYEGTLAEMLARDLAEVGSPIDAGDLRRYRARAVEPMLFPYGTANVCAMPGLYAGLTLQRTLSLMGEHVFTGDWPDENAFLAYVTALKRAYAERLSTMGDTGDGPGLSCTSHLCVIDAKGDMVCLTQTLLSLFGSRVVLPETGILMNNGVMWFDPEPGRPNSIAPGKRPLSNMCPVIAENDHVRLAIGASGGRRILPAVTQIMSFVFDYHMPLEDAFAQPRIDVSGEDMVTISQDLWNPIPQTLAAHHPTRIVQARVYPNSYACPVAVLHDKVDNHHYGTAEVIHPWADAVAEPVSE
ncbi:MAG: gamma-glutamyltransferase [Geminicoccaceae bacterium]|nr:gamma-glutamyltransferase [Geminicoccaceae bacterium]